MMNMQPISASSQTESESGGTGRAYHEEKAVEYMKNLGFSDLVAVWYNATDDVAVINLAPEVNGVIYYTDLVKVKTALPSGEIVGFECSGYCEKSKERTLSPAISEQAAMAKVSPKITVVSSRLCVIPVGEKEKFCYEFAGEYTGLDYFVYIDAVTGDEANILRVVDNEQGSMTM